MKRIISCVIVAVLITVSLCGCNFRQFYNKQEILSVSDYFGLQTRELSKSDSKIITDILNDAFFMDGLGNCACDYTIKGDDFVYTYHSDCGCFNDEHLGKCYTASDEDRIKINNILKKYIHTSQKVTV